LDLVSIEAVRRWFGNAETIEDNRFTLSIFFNRKNGLPVLLA
jgi:hypothetical protein